MLRIEAARLCDLPGAYRTCLLTGDTGADASALAGDPDLLGHVYVGPYLARGIGTQLVLVDEAGSAGYLLSTDDTRDFEAWAEANWWPPLRARYPLVEDGSSLRSFDAELIELIHRPRLAPPEILDEYPAHLHIDLEERARGTGLGRLLIERLLTELRERGVAGVHLEAGDDNERAIGFYGHLGFRELQRRPGGVLMGLRLD